LRLNTLVQALAYADPWASSWLPGAAIAFPGRRALRWH